MRILVANPIQILFPPMAKEFVAFKKGTNFIQMFYHFHGI